MTETTTAQRWQLMLRLQGDESEQIRWIACHLGRLYDRIGKLEKKVAALKGAATRAKKREGK